MFERLSQSKILQGLTFVHWVGGNVNLAFCVAKSVWMSSLNAPSME